MTTQTIHEAPEVREYLEQVRRHLPRSSPDDADLLLGRATAEIELEADLRYVDPADGEAVRAVLARLGSPEAMAARIRDRAAESDGTLASGLVSCRACRKEVSRDAVACPHCGAPRPSLAIWRGQGYEWKSQATFRGWPLVHIAWGRDQKGRIRVARGVIAVGQFGIGAVTIAQFGIGFVFGLGQFMLAPVSIGQFAFGLLAAGQFGIGLLAGAGQVATGVFSAGMKAFGIWTRSAL